MSVTSLHEGGAHVVQLREALATTELQLKEARAELGRLVRITERNLAEATADAQGANERTEALSARLENHRHSSLALIRLMLESELLPPELVMSWLVQSGVFNPDYYLLANEDVATAGLDPVEHFISYGLNEGRPFSDAFPEQS